MNMVVILAIVAAALFLYLALKGKSKDDIFRTFGLDSTSYELVGTDLGKGHARKRISAHGVSGEPDAIFRHKRTGRLIVCEYKSRRWNRRMRPREYFQIVLYVGISREQFRTDDVIGILAFKDKTLEIEHNPTLCASLIQLRGEVLGSMKSKKALNSRPLLSRARFPVPFKVERF
ncbi:hypothetical protein IIE18_11405 [Pseudomonas sp. V1]|uniref:hypothetical protein n=1 Tax=Pseudomonas arcuscaelestis TaxID=2710591 RepID=UPI00194005BE|nr:hypothetical protein [Pseudomonas arcuscaelestis]MBM3105748.1 hypothetical protein [Pseudomonas arcuscaelestis]